jgi:hypothetical protein
MKRKLLPKRLGGEKYGIVEWKLVAVWNDGLVEEFSQDLADDSTLAMEVESYCRDYTELRNEDPKEYNSSEW